MGPWPASGPRCDVAGGNSSSYGLRPPGRTATRSRFLERRLFGRQPSEVWAFVRVRGQRRRKPTPTGETFAQGARPGSSFPAPGCRGRSSWPRPTVTPPLADGIPRKIPAPTPGPAEEGPGVLSDDPRQTGTALTADRCWILPVRKTDHPRTISGRGGSTRGSVSIALRFAQIDDHDLRGSRTVNEPHGWEAEAGPARRILRKGTTGRMETSGDPLCRVERSADLIRASGPASRTTTRVPSTGGVQDFTSPHRRQG